MNPYIYWYLVRTSIYRRDKSEEKVQEEYVPMKEWDPNKIHDIEDFDF